MKSATRAFLTSVLFLTATGALAQTSAPPATVSKDCKGLRSQARQECLKVARQMEIDAAKPHDPTTTTPESSGPSSETVHHSSPVMQTPEEKKAAAKTAAPAPATSPPAPAASPPK
jgi:hypothetical protein